MKPTDNQIEKFFVDRKLEIQFCVGHYYQMVLDQQKVGKTKRDRDRFLKRSTGFLSFLHEMHEDFDMTEEEKESLAETEMCAMRYIAMQGALHRMMVDDYLVLAIRDLYSMYFSVNPLRVTCYEGSPFLKVVDKVFLYPDMGLGKSKVRYTLSKGKVADSLRRINATIGEDKSRLAKVAVDFGNYCRNVGDEEKRKERYQRLTSESTEVFQQWHLDRLKDRFSD